MWLIDVQNFVASGVRGRACNSFKEENRLQIVADHLSSGGLLME